MRHRADRRRLDGWSRPSALGAPGRTGMLVGAALVVTGALLGLGLVTGAPGPGDSGRPVAQQRPEQPGTSSAAASTPSPSRLAASPSRPPRPTAPSAPGTVRPSAGTPAPAPTPTRVAESGAPVPVPVPTATVTSVLGHGHGRGRALGHHKP